MSRFTRQMSRRPRPTGAVRITGSSEAGIEFEPVLFSGLTPAQVAEFDQRQARTETDVGKLTVAMEAAGNLGGAEQVPVTYLRHLHDAMRRRLVQGQCPHVPRPFHIGEDRVIVGLSTGCVTCSRKECVRAATESLVDDGRCDLCDRRPANGKFAEFVVIIGGTYVVGNRCVDCDPSGSP